MFEQWKDVKGYEGLYQVSSLGNVKSLPRIINNHTGQYWTKEIELKQVLSRGYMRVSLLKDRKRKHIPVHRLVAESFISNPFNKPQVNHIDGNKLNNHVENLEWVTCSENVKHAFDHALKAPINRITIYQVSEDGEVVNVWESLKELESSGTLSHASYESSKKKNHKAKGYLWFTSETEVNEYRKSINK